MQLTRFACSHFPVPTSKSCPDSQVLIAPRNILLPHDKYLAQWERMLKLPLLTQRLVKTGLMMSCPNRKGVTGRPPSLTWRTDSSLGRVTSKSAEICRSFSSWISSCNEHLAVLRNVIHKPVPEGKTYSQIHFFIGFKIASFFVVFLLKTASHFFLERFS